MFALKDNKEIGIYLSKLIKARGYKSDRAFCKAYLEHEHREVNDDEIRKMANRVSQMLKGAKGKGVQVYDLPVFCYLLGVTCEEILSAGASFVQNGSRDTNYSVAFSKDSNDWETFIHREDKLILNPDEYGKTVIDYAIEFNNYELIKYLIENNYIWFDSREEDAYGMTFGAGTSIQRRNPLDVDTFLQYKGLHDDQLRMNIIALAVKNKDRQILDELRAREIPQLYYKVHYWSGSQLDFNENYNEDMVNQIAAASNEIIDYFTDTFEIDDRIKFKDGAKRTNKFIFPYISELLDGLIENNHSFAEIALNKCIQHNKKTYELIKQMIPEAIEKELERYDFGDEKYLEQCRPSVFSRVLGDFDFNENGQIISFRGLAVGNGIVTNIACTGVESKDFKMQYLMNELKEYYHKIVHIANEYVNEENQ